MLVLVAIYDRVCTRSRDRALIIPGLIRGHGHVRGFYV